MFTTHKRVPAQALLAVSALLTGALLTGCSGDSSAASDADGSSGGKADPALAYSQCMRDNGVPDFPDPEEGGIKLTPESGVDMDSESFKAAEEACRDKAPQGMGGDKGGTLDSAKVTAWAKCLRANGVPEFPDPEIDGSNMSIDLSGGEVDPSGPEFSEAMSACQDKYPGGGVRFSGGGGGQ